MAVPSFPSGVVSTPPSTLNVATPASMLQGQQVLTISPCSSPSPGPGLSGSRHTWNPDGSQRDSAASETYDPDPQDGDLRLSSGLIAPEASPNVRPSPRTSPTPAVSARSDNSALLSPPEKKQTLPRRVNPSPQPDPKPRAAAPQAPQVEVAKVAPATGRYYDRNTLPAELPATPEQTVPIEVLQQFLGLANDEVIRLRERQAKLREENAILEQKSDELARTLEGYVQHYPSKMIANSARAVMTPCIGIELVDTPYGIHGGKMGLKVRKVTDKNVGLKVGDFIRSWGDVEVINRSDFLILLGDSTIGSTVGVEVIRPPAKEPINVRVFVRGTALPKAQPPEVERTPRGSTATPLSEYSEAPSQSMAMASPSATPLWRY